MTAFIEFLLDSKVEKARRVIGEFECNFLTFTPMHNRGRKEASVDPGGRADAGLFSAAGHASELRSKPSRG
jgi:hypothetical protein